MTLRKLLDALYDAAAVLGAFAMVGLLAMVLLAIAARQLHFNVAGSDAYAGYLMAAAGFLALAHTFKRGDHIRVTLVVTAVKGASRRALELWSLGAGSALALLFAGYSIRLAWQSYRFHDISTGNDATPLWLPQLAMAIGTSILAIALIDEMVLELRGRRVAARTLGEAAHVE
jgi:TRAP-type C4-dicarboxylate transport system permease small subunit